MSDANVVLQALNAVKTFNEQDVIVPMAVIQELDEMARVTWLKKAIAAERLLN